MPPRITVHLVRGPSPWSLAALLALSLACVPQQRFADLGDFTLENGEIIRGCRVGYRTSGELDAARAARSLRRGGPRDAFRQLVIDPDDFDRQAGAIACESGVVQGAVARFLRNGHGDAPR